MTHHSTQLKMHSQHCPSARARAVAGETGDTRQFQAGIAAHAVLQAMAEKQPKTLSDAVSVARAVAETLVSNGRTFEGRREPPMAPESASEGVSLAMAWLEMNDMPRGRAEVGLGVSHDMSACMYEDAYAAAILDLVYDSKEVTEEYEADVLVVRDYKSAWPTNESELYTLQRKIQLCVAFAHYCAGSDKYAAIKLEVCNLRTWRTYDRLVWLDEEGLREIDEAWQEILLACYAAESTDEAIPGAGCLGCPFVTGCVTAETASINYEPDYFATSYAVSKALSDARAGHAKAACKESGPVEVQGGSVGYHQANERVLADGAVQRIVEEWFGEHHEHHDQIAGLVTALAPTVTSVESLAKALYPTRSEIPDRRAFVDELVEVRKVARFGVQKNT